MKKVKLTELSLNSRQEVIRFLKKLWNEEGSDCPFCGQPLELLHQKAKKSSSDWQCKACDRVFRTIDLMNEMNEQMP